MVWSTFDLVDLLSLEYDEKECEYNYGTVAETKWKKIRNIQIKIERKSIAHSSSAMLEIVVGSVLRYFCTGINASGGTAGGRQGNYPSRATITRCCRASTLSISPISHGSYMGAAQCFLPSDDDQATAYRPSTSTTAKCASVL
jgi:hypothetical protein